MQYGLSGVDRVEATAKGRAICPFCGEGLVAKCGKIRVHHWAHESGQDCDRWFEPETAWHREWKLKFPRECVEVPIGNHRADIRFDNRVIELQNSSIGPDEIREREEFYGRRMIWVLNGAPFISRFFLMKELRDGLFTFKWKHMKSSWRFAQRPVFIDFGPTSVHGLRGQSAKRITEGVNMKGEPELLVRKVIERSDAPLEIKESVNKYASEAKLEVATLMRIKTVYENGFGSVSAVETSTFFEMLGFKLANQIV